jgi:hypothetical protein
MPPEPQAAQQPPAETKRQRTARAREWLRNAVKCHPHDPRRKTKAKWEEDLYELMKEAFEQAPPWTLTGFRRRMTDLRAGKLK